jgi:isocitrate/isopropylmalate dehydrogenase
MSKYRVALLPGDGIGKEVLDSALMVLDKLGFQADYAHGDIGWEFWRKEGDALPARTIKVLKSTDCVLFGAITSKPDDQAQVELHPDLAGQDLVYRSPILRLRQLFDLYVAQRPCKSYEGNPLNVSDKVDLVVFRENTEGLYVGAEYHPLHPEVRAVLAKHNPAMQRFADVPDDEIAVGLRVITKKGAARILRKGFEYAANHGLDKVTLAEKPNVLRKTSGLMEQEARKLLDEFPGIQLEMTNIDAQMMWLLKNPEYYGVIVTSNLFGDILSDLGAQMVGGMGFAASGNIGNDYAIFEPSHGSAPKYAGMGVANPIAMILSAKMMLEWLGETGMALYLDQAIARVVAKGEVRSKDMGGSASTGQMAQAVIDEL